jgi:hypothetical protein
VPRGKRDGSLQPFSWLCRPVNETENVSVYHFVYLKEYSGTLRPKRYMTMNCTAGVYFPLNSILQRDYWIFDFVHHPAF